MRRLAVAAQQRRVPNRLFLGDGGAEPCKERLVHLLRRLRDVAIDNGLHAAQERRVAASTGFSMYANVPRARLRSWQSSDP